MLRPIIFTACLAAAQLASAAEAGKVIFVAGNVQVAGKAAELNGAVGEGELLTTGADGYLYIKTVDNGLFIVRPNSKARIATYFVDRQNPSNTRIKLELLSGVARSQSGDAVKLARQNFRFNTPVAAIGVRGTDFTVFTDQHESRVTVLSGGITVSAFSGACAPEGTGPCEGSTARDLYATQRGLLLRVQKGQATPQLMQGGATLAPDVVVPPRADEPVKVTVAPDVNLDPKKDIQLQPGKDTNKPPVVTVPPEVVVKEEPETPPKPVRQVTWGRWAEVASQAPTSAFSKAGATRIAMNENYVLFRNNEGSEFVTPERGNVSFTLADSSATVANTKTLVKNFATVTDGLLSFDFGKSSFSTSFKLNVSPTEVISLASEGQVYKDGMFNSTPGANMVVTGALTDLENANYLFRTPIGNNRIATGATSWRK